MAVDQVVGLLFELCTRVACVGIRDALRVAAEERLGKRAGKNAVDLLLVGFGKPAQLRTNQLPYIKTALLQSVGDLSVFPLEASQKRLNFLKGDGG